MADHISKTLAAVQSGLQTSSTRSQGATSHNAAGLPIHWTSAILKKLQARYGHKWTAAIDGIEGEVVSEWSRGLAGLTGDQIKIGLDGWDSEWPPSMPEFRAACLGKKLGLNDFGLTYVPEYYRQTKTPERDPAKLLSNDDREKRRAEAKAKMAEIKARLHGKA